jgi:hypothetical protein
VDKNNKLLLDELKEANEFSRNVKDSSVASS